MPTPEELDAITANAKASRMILAPDPTLIALPWRISSKLTQTPAPAGLGLSGDCLIWNGKWVTGNGYVKVSWQGKDRVAHRVIYEFFCGEVDPKILLDHRCERRPCCQPLHLDPVTTKVNTYRGRAVLFKRQLR